MIAILYNRSLTDEVLSTTICLVEQTLNTRPLTAVSDDPEDLTALTANHFLFGRENAKAPFMPSSERHQDLRKSFKTARAYADMIWKRWTREYLPQWNQRSKWSKEHVRNLKEGELVWLVDDSVKRCEYKLGRIIEIFTGNDGVVRPERVNMAHGELNRPVVKLRQYFKIVFPRSKTGPSMLAPLQISYESHQIARNNVWNWKNLKFVKTQ